MRKSEMQLHPSTNVFIQHKW